METEIYQGWSNAATWCVALTLDNEKDLHDQALAIARGNPESSDPVEIVYSLLISLHLKKIYAMAPWVWEKYSIAQVNLAELHSHYYAKVKEEKDPTPWCNACGSMTRKNCKCPPMAENE